MKDRVDIHQHITDEIVAAIEKGVGTFQMPWHTLANKAIRPKNIASKKFYQGINTLVLWVYAEKFGYTSGIWGTYKQWAEAGCQVRKGEKSSYVTFYKTYEVEVDGSDDAETRRVAKTTPVFAVEQVEGFEMPAEDFPPAPGVTPVEHAEHFIASTGAAIHHGGDRAFYRPATDSITMPDKNFFTGTKTSTPEEAYYSTIFHELTHWTSHRDRCDRELGKKFGDHAYAMEELVAELSAAFLCNDLRITSETREDHAQYISSWLKLLKADKRAIFAAAAKAFQAATYLHSLQKDQALAA
jgi:antirestriction protein ArdC